MIQFMSLENQVKAIKDEVMSEIEYVIDNCQFVLGPQLEQFEKSFAEYNKSKYCVGLSDGTAAIVAALKSLNLSNDDEVIIQSNSYIAAPLAVEFCHLKIKIVDIDDNLNMDLDELEKSINESTKVVIVVHLYGACPDMHRLMQLKQKYGFHLIEDAAQAHGSMFDSKKLGTFGDIGCFSFYPSKNLGCFGEGGCVITDNQLYYDYILKYRNYGSIERYQWDIKGNNNRLHNIQAAILNVKLKYLDDWNISRNKLAQIYNKHLYNIKDIYIPINHDLLFQNYHLYVIMVPSSHRDSLIDHLKNNNIGTGVHYPHNFYKSGAFKELNHLNFKADSTCEKLISLPIYPELSSDMVNNVCKHIQKYFNNI